MNKSKYPRLDSGKVCLNIKNLALIKGIKIGDLERKAGLSTGYMSRVMNAEHHNTFDKYLNLIVTAANMMQVSFEDLLFKDYEIEKRKHQEEMLDILNKLQTLPRGELKLIIRNLNKVNKDKQDEQNKEDD